MVRVNMDYTCENCRNRFTWDCEDNWNRQCEDFELDENTLSEKEQMILRVLRQIMKEKNGQYE